MCQGYTDLCICLWFLWVQFFVYVMVRKLCNMLLSPSYDHKEHVIINSCHSFRKLWKSLKQKFVCVFKPVKTTWESIVVMQHEVKPFGKIWKFLDVSSTTILQKNNSATVRYPPNNWVKLHTKKSKWVIDGSAWIQLKSKRTALVRNTFNEEIILYEQ